LRRPKKKSDVAIIGGTGLEDMLEAVTQVRIGTPYGVPPPISLGSIEDRPLAFLPRHGIHHSMPPHRVNYRANIYALHQIGIERIVATNAVGAINKKFRPSDLVVPHDLVDFTKSRSFTFYNNAPVTHIDLTQPYCPEIRLSVINAAKECNTEVWDHAVLVCTEGPRYETPAEIEMFRRLGCDVVGMTGVPEAVLARELEMCYATLCFISNRAAGMQQRLTVSEVAEVAEERIPVIQQILRETIKNLSEERNCPCTRTLEDARIRGDR
jgi:5'-methylthioadenosine phosphorylase